MLSRSSDPFSHLRSPFTVYTRATIPAPCRSSNHVTSPTHIFRSTSLTALTHFEQTNLRTRLIAYCALAEFKRFLNLIRYAWLNFIFSGLVLLYVMQYHSQQEHSDRNAMKCAWLHAPGVWKRLYTPPSHAQVISHVLRIPPHLSPICPLSVCGA
ncbi:hypothetical protein Agabi119p4_1437 [Agaricus bisporus var. burnettii]|uniref:Uncharacterized protein n=1 Tax=Agaricus bisporus var. burnettii TaxID=192524 RepID=A0A8H7F9W1_AGABI|nr:hypothetical protein Agabi119p4_1437 [Agaricus bisporus var. burnettii]